ncbi:MAG TPA: O-antigen ligase family protein [Pyrinomonadaceae bacterium]|nr:O-antigen ligase family protein [Pyrinomonadaceae bacterium]
MTFTEIFRKIDELNNLTTGSKAVLWLERTAFIFLTVMILFAPHSIAVTQSAWLIGMLAWVIRLFFKPRVKFKLTAIDYALWSFFAWSVVSSIFSYAPDISLDKLRGVSLFLIFYFVYNNLRTIRAAKFLAFALIFSAMFAVLWTPVERVIGRGVEIYDFRGSAFDQIGLQEGDAILQINGKKVKSLEEVRRRVFENPSEPQFKAQIYRDDAYTMVDVPRERIKQAATPEESLGVGRWTRNHNWRAAGFYGHFTTFAEVLQLILSLTFGLFIITISKHRFFARNEEKETVNKYLKPQILLGICAAGLAFALLLTVTRASQFAFFVAALTIVLLNGNRKIIRTLLAMVLPLAIIGFIVYGQTRKIGFDLSDASTQYRVMMWRDGARLWTVNPHNFIFGVGMDSIKRYWREWDLFDQGRQPQGHFHSTLVQLVVERGLPALLIWLTILGVYARTLWRGLKVSDSRFQVPDSEPQTTSVADENLKSEIRNPKSEIERGIILGCFGGLVGFFTSGLVHYNLGDGEVAMVFYILMGISVFVCDFRQKEPGETEKHEGH